MPGMLLKVLLYASVPMAATVFGAIVAAYRPPSPRIRSGIQHFAAGVVFCALGVEILPDVVHHRAPVAAIIGFAIGVALMLGIQWVTQKSAAQTDGKIKSSTGLLAAVGVDIGIDGLLVGVGFVAGAKAGVLLTIALSLEMVSIGLAVAAELGQSGATRNRILATVSGLSLLIAGGATVGVLGFGGAQGDLLEATLAFGSAALLFLVTEELLVEAHEVPETQLTTAMFFAGFLLLLVVDMFS